MKEAPGAERRRYQRQTLRHDALLAVQGSDPVACQVANICEEGMWLESVAASSVTERLTQDPTLPVEVHLFIDGDGSEQHRKLAARVRRIHDWDLGIQFEEPVPDLIALLNQPATSCSSSTNW